jgi:hypothetical protein
VLRQLCEVVRLVAAGQQSGEDRRMQRLHPAAKDLVRLRQLGDRPDSLDSRLGQVGSRAVGGEALGPGVDEAAGKLDDAVSVTD